MFRKVLFVLFILFFGLVIISAATATEHSDNSISTTFSKYKSSTVGFSESSGRSIATAVWIY